MKLNKTEQKILNYAKKNGGSYYAHGRREFNAAFTLEKKGLGVATDQCFRAYTGRPGYFTTAVVAHFEMKDAN